MKYSVDRETVIYLGDEGEINEEATSKIFLGSLRP